MIILGGMKLPASDVREHPLPGRLSPPLSRVNFQGRQMNSAGVWSTLKGLAHARTGDLKVRAITLT